MPVSYCMKAVCIQNKGSHVENRPFVGISLPSPLFSYTFLYYWTSFLSLPMDFFLFYSCTTPSSFVFLYNATAVLVPLVALALTSIFFFSLVVQRVVSFNGHNSTVYSPYFSAVTELEAAGNKREDFHHMHHSISQSYKILYGGFDIPVLEILL